MLLFRAIGSDNYLLFDENDYLDSDTLTVLFEDREVIISEGAFSDQFDPYQVHIYAQEY